jgi:hypothetical protein
LSANILYGRKKGSRGFNSSRNYSEDTAHFKAPFSFALGIFSLFRDAEHLEGGVHLSASTNQLVLVLT